MLDKQALACIKNRSLFSDDTLARFVPDKEEHPHG
jgi:hypothetical protein